MRVLINIDKSDLFDEIQIDVNDTIETLFYIIEGTFEIPFHTIQLTVDGILFNFPLSTMIKDTFIKNDSMILVKKKENSIQQPVINKQNQTSLGNIFENTMKMLNNNQDTLLQSEASREANIIYSKCMNNPSELSILFNTDEKLAEAVASGSVKAVEEEIFSRMKAYKDKKNKDHEEYTRLVNSNSNDEESQKKIEKYIHQQQVQQNKQYAIEHFPESFFSVHHMLYIPLEINKYKVIALVDTGAQSTIMSVDIAHKSGLYNLIDTDYKGKAVGVGESNIIGVIHCAQIKIGNNFIMAKITVIENISVGFIFGLDNMRSHRCSIELFNNRLLFKDAGFHIDFLSDGEIKKQKVENELLNKELLNNK